jgi:hypothetical protein
LARKKPNLSSLINDNLYRKYKKQSKPPKQMTKYRSYQIQC